MTKEPKLISGNVGSLLIRLTIPMIVGMLGMVIFNLVDTFFVGKLGTQQLAALSFTFPVVMVINSFALGIGQGASVLVSRSVGGAEIEKARFIATDALILGVIIAFFFSVLGIVFSRSLFAALGAEGIILDYVVEYMQIWFTGCFMVVFPMIGNNVIRALGDTKVPGFVMLFSAVVNAILDPLLIFGIWIFPELGIRGAAIATVFARGITMLLALLILVKRENMITFKSMGVERLYRSWQEILHIGIPNSAIMMAMPLGIGIVTRILAGFGPSAVAGFGVASRIEFFANAPLAALGSIMGPFLGQNLGSQKWDRILKGRKLAELYSLGIGLFMAALLFVFARPIARIFTDNSETISYTVLYLRIVPISYGLNGILRIASTTFNVLKKPLTASGLIILQTFVIYVPGAYLGSRLFGVPGIFGSLTLSYIFAGIIGHLGIVRKLNSIIDGSEKPPPITGRLT